MKRLLILSLLLLPVPAYAQEYSATVSPETVVFGQDTRVTWRITIKTGDEPVQGAVVLEADAVSPAQHGADGFNAAVVDTAEVRLEGPGELRRSPLIGDPCWVFYESLPTYGLRAFHGDLRLEGQRLDIDLPANSESVLVVPAVPSKDAPWPGTTFGLRAKVAGTTLDLPRAEAGGPRGVPLTFTTEPAATRDICSDRPRLPYGTVKVTGRTDPELSGDRVHVVDAHEDGVRHVGEATVQADGTFVLDGWRPAPGDHNIAVRYASQRSDRTDDFAHPQWFATEQPPPPPPPPVAPTPPPARSAPQLLGTSRVAAGFVTVRLKCESAAGCRGTVRLRRSGRRVAARRYAFARVARVRLRLASATRRSLRRNRRLSAQLVLAPDAGKAVSQRVVLRRRQVACHCR